MHGAAWRMATSCRGVVLAAVLGVGACSSADVVGGEVTGDARFTATVTRVIDGDTIVVRYDDAKTDKVRLIGVDTPETHKPGVAVQCFGPQAEQFTRSTLTGKRVRLELDRDERDRYDRLLAYVYVDGKRFEDELLRGGYARHLAIRPNTRYAREFLALETSAKRDRKGLWNAC